MMAGNKIYVDKILHFKTKGFLFHSFYIYDNLYSIKKYRKIRFLLIVSFKNYYTHNNTRLLSRTTLQQTTRIRHK